MIYLLEYHSVGAGQDRITEHSLGRELLRFGLEQQYGLSGIVQQKSGGKPYLDNMPGVYFNISHTSGLVVCGMDEREIGIDVERVRPYDRRLMHRICTDEEMDYICGGNRDGEQMQNERFFQLWTLKESYLKATGQGLAVPMRGISFVLDGRDPIVIESNVPGWEFWQFRYSNRYIISQCRESKNENAENGGKSIMTYEEIFDKVKELFQQADVSDVKEHLAYQFNIIGEGEGAFYAEIQDGKLDIQPYEYYDRDAIFICKAEVLFGIISGKVDPVKAFTLGKLKVEGSLDKALKLKDFVKNQ